MRGFLTGHISVGPLTIYGRNAMHWGVTVKSKKYGYICFRLPLWCFGKWWPLYLYFSPNATPQASTFMIGKKHGYHSWAYSRVRLYKFGHNFDVDGLRKEFTELGNRSVGGIE